MLPAARGTEIHLRLELSSVPHCVGLIRELVRTVGRGEQLAGDLLDDMRSAISEACNNVVLHAYPHATGPLVFSLTFGEDWIDAVVRDRGCGIRPGAGRTRGLGMGVTLINALADRAEFESSPLGTEVRMRFRRPKSPERPVGLSLAIWALSCPGSSDALRAQSN